ncbi:MAG: hypothetical protein Kow00111_16510 [Thermincola ferriacetica]
MGPVKLIVFIFKPHWLIGLFLVLVMGLGIISPAGSVKPVGATRGPNNTIWGRFGCAREQQRHKLNYKKIIIFSDPHYYTPELGTTGAAFEEYLAGDRKLLAESNAILRKTINQIKASDAGIVLISGDLTKDGELVNHLKVASYLKELEDSGRKVYVINGNHDINNPHAFKFEGARVIPVENVSPEQFKEIYKDFGYAEALAVDTNSLSYVVEPVQGLRLIVMDSAIYDRNHTVGRPKTEGAFSEATLNWIIGQIKKAKAQGKIVLGMMHHGLMDHFSVQRRFFAQYVIKDADRIAVDLADAGMAAVFTGHFHAQDITAQQIGNKYIYDVETGSLVTYPNPYRIIELTADNKLRIKTWRIEEIDYDTGSLKFPVYAKKYLTDGLRDLAPHFLARIIMGQGLTEEEAAEQAALIVRQKVSPFMTLGDLLATIMVAHYQGDEVLDEELLPVIQRLVASESPLLGMLGEGLLSLGTDLEPADNDIIIPLQP